MNQPKKKNNTQRYIERCMQQLQKRQNDDTLTDERPRDWYNFHCRTDEFIVPSKWVTRLDEANAVHAHFQYLHDKLDAVSLKETNRIDREALYCSSALYKMRQNAFRQRLHEHQNRWHSVTLIGELASTLPKPTTDPIEIERQLYISLTKKK